MLPLDGRGRPPQPPANQRNLVPIVGRSVNAASSITPAFVVTAVVSGGQRRRRVYLTRHGARTAAERDLAAGRAATVIRAKLLVGVPVATTVGA